MESDARIFVGGHRGLVGSAIVRKLLREGFRNIVTRTRDELDLRDQRAVHDFFASEDIHYVFLAAARVGGIYANATQRVDFLYDNTLVAMNAIHAAAEHGVAKLLYLGSSCIYPKFAPQPIPETALLTGELEPTNEAYAIAKIAGLKLCEYYARDSGKRFISAMPTNLYGPNDNFDPLNSHVVPGLMRRFYEGIRAGAEEVVVWGSGRPRRELLHVDDLADALFLLMQEYEQPDFVNIGSGEDREIRELAEIIGAAVGFSGRIVYDGSKPDGTPRKLLDVSRMRALGWQARIPLEEGLRSTYAWALENRTFE
ncbi:MAG TPA: GDP-L-fucose synthase [Thermoanaerobaculia bacterium]|jgi:GDP-L-fucose synthase|nr:GDP-L-fucose synthase [Thermoanaerobaculia bacterium]